MSLEFEGCIVDYKTNEQGQRRGQESRRNENRELWDSMKLKKISQSLFIFPHGHFFLC
jgi:hypothetical protein